MRAQIQRPIIRRYTPASYKPTFTKSTERAWYQRLTPLAWMLSGVSGLMVVAMISTGITKIGEARNGTQTLSDYLGTSSSAAIVAAQPAAQNTTQAVSVAQPAQAAADMAVKPAQAVQAVQQAAPQTVVQPTAAPAVVPVAAPALPVAPGAPWAAALVKQADGTMVAPAEVLQRASADVQAWFQSTRALNAKNYLQKRDTQFDQYLTGSALDTVRQQSAAQKQFTINRKGNIAVEVKGFSADGLTAKAGVVTRGWVNDVYVAKTGKLAQKNATQVDQLTIMTIQFDVASNHWKIASIDDVAPLK